MNKVRIWRSIKDARGGIRHFHANQYPLHNDVVNHPNAYGDSPSPTRLKQPYSERLRTSGVSDSLSSSGSSPVLKLALDNISSPPGSPDTLSDSLGTTSPETKSTGSYGSPGRSSRISGYHQLANSTKNGGLSPNKQKISPSRISKKTRATYANVRPQTSGPRLRSPGAKKSGKSPVRSPVRSGSKKKLSGNYTSGLGSTM